MYACLRQQIISRCLAYRQWLNQDFQVMEGGTELQAGGGAREAGVGVTCRTPARQLTNA